MLAIGLPALRHQEDRGLPCVLCTGKAVRGARGKSVVGRLDFDATVQRYLGMSRVELLIRTAGWQLETRPVTLSLHSVPVNETNVMLDDDKRSWIHKS